MHLGSTLQRNCVNHLRIVVCHVKRKMLHTMFYLFVFLCTPFFFLLTQQVKLLVCTRLFAPFTQLDPVLLGMGSIH